jgi:hypothetical protein
MDHSHHAQAVAATVAHEMGHNFGCEHDTDVASGCACASPTDKCIMAPMTRCGGAKCALRVICMQWPRALRMVRM